LKTNRRSLIKALTIGGGAVTAAKLPSVWTAPVVEAVTLPAHAQTTEQPTEPTTGFTVLQGSGPANPIAEHSSPKFDNYAENGSDNRSLLDQFIGTAHADEEPVRSAYGYAERNFGNGDGWWNIEFLLHEELPIYDVSTSPNIGPFPLDRLTSVAHAGVNNGSSCISETLWKATVKIESSGNSNSETHLEHFTYCGRLPFSEVDLRIENADDPNNPTSAELVAGFGSDELARIPLTGGGSPLSTNCGSDECEPR